MIFWRISIRLLRKPDFVVALLQRRLSKSPFRSYGNRRVAGIHPSAGVWITQCSSFVEVVFERGHHVRYRCRVGSAGSSFIKNRPTVIFIEPEDPRVVEAAFDLPRFCRPVFLASRDQVAALIRGELAAADPSKAEFLLSESAFCPIDSRPDLIDEFAQAYGEIIAKKERKGKNAVSLDEGRRFASTPAGFGILAVARGHADLVVGGSRHEPRDYFRPLLRS